MAIAFRSHTTNTLDGSSTAVQKIISLARPAGLANNDLLLIQIGSRQADGTSRALSASLSLTGFEKLANGVSDLTSSLYRVWTFGKVITDAASETTTYTINIPVVDTSDKQIIAGIAAAFSGVNTINPYHTGLTYNTTTTVTTTYSAITTTSPNTMLILAGISQRSVTVTFNGGVTKIADPSVATTTGATVFMGYKDQAAAGNTGDFTSYINDTARVQYYGMFALNEAGGLAVSSVDSDNAVYSLQADTNVVGTGLSAGVTVTYKGIACSVVSASSSTSIKVTFPDFYSNNIKLGTQNEFKVVG